MLIKESVTFYKKARIYRAFLFILLMFLFSIPIKMPVSEGTVTEVRDGYYILRRGFSCAMVYDGNTEVGIGDRVEV